jgi:hypothetical protein
MLGVGLLALRESVEAGLVIGAVLAMTGGIPGGGLWIAFGAAIGLGLTLGLLPLGLVGLADLGSARQPALDVALLAAAIVMIAWQNVWFNLKGHRAHGQLGTVLLALSVGSRSLLGLAAVIALVVLRDGVEVVLFALAMDVPREGAMIFLEAAAGACAGAALVVVAYRNLILAEADRAIAIASLILVFFAAEMAAEIASELGFAPRLPAMVATAWALIPYAPPLPEALAFLATASALLALTFAARRLRREVRQDPA